VRRRGRRAKRAWLGGEGWRKKMDKRRWVGGEGEEEGRGRN
jgi:hypothetical protein